MTIRLSARSRSMTSATKAGACAAESATTNRSTLSGQRARGRARSGRRRWRPTPGFTTTIRSRAKPSRRRLPRMTRPGFDVLETPTIATERGASSRASLCTGRDARVGRRAVAERDQDVERDEARRAVTAAGLISHSSSSAGARAAPSASRRSTTSTSCPSARRGGWPRSEVVARRTAVVACERRRRSHRAASGSDETIAISRPGRRSGGEGLRVDPAGTDAHDRPEVVGPAQREEQLAAHGRRRARPARTTR